MALSLPSMAAVSSQPPMTADHIPGKIGRDDSPHGFNTLISGSGLGIGLGRGSPVSHCAAPFAFTGTLRRVTVTLGPLPGAVSMANRDALAQVEMARQ